MPMPAASKPMRRINNFDGIRQYRSLRKVRNVQWQQPPSKRRFGRGHHCSAFGLAKPFTICTLGNFSSSCGFKITLLERLPPPFPSFCSPKSGGSKKKGNPGGRAEGRPPADLHAGQLYGLFGSGEGSPLNAQQLTNGSVDI